MTTTKSSHWPPDKRILNSQPTNLLRATACYFGYKLIIGAIRNIVGGGGMRVRDSSNGMNSKRTIDVSESNLKCLSDFCHFFFILMTKVISLLVHFQNEPLKWYFFIDKKIWNSSLLTFYQI